MSKKWSSTKCQKMDTKMSEMIYITRISIFLKTADNLYLEGFLDEKSRDATVFGFEHF